MICENGISDGINSTYLGLFLNNFKAIKAFSSTDFKKSIAE
jgi:hypothetical protein